MTRVDFYGLPEVRAEARERFAIRLLSRAWREGMRSVLLLPDDSGRDRLAEALWAQPGAFLPHAHFGTKEAERTPVLLATPEGMRTAPPVDDAAGLLVNLTEAIPEGFAAFERVAEIVCSDEEMRNRARGHYLFYRERGYPLDYHELGKKGS